MKDITKENKWDEVLKRYVREGREAGLTITQTQSGWQVITKCDLRYYAETDSKLIGYIQGYTGR